MQTGEHCFVKHPEESWVVGVVQSATSARCEDPVRKCDGVMLDKLKPDDLTNCREDLLDETPDDLLNLTVLHDATLLRCLYIRYMKDIVYTNIGAIVVALNPFNYKIPHYQDDQMPRYLAEGQVIENCLPHSWAQAHNTYNEMMSEAQNQSILISGESGAGKTEATKIVMKYLAQISALKGTAEERESGLSVGTKLVQCSPILESFGNAKTVRNDNSSRFGKFMSVKFDPKGLLVGAYTEKYLLEKSRIVTAAEGERVYHAFYITVRGHVAKNLALKADTAYKSLNAGKTLHNSEFDTAEHFAEVYDAMERLGMSSDSIASVWKCTGGILAFLNVTFAPDGEGSVVTKDTRSELEAAVKLWSIDTAALEKELLTTTLIIPGGEKAVKVLKPELAVDMRDALVKAVYNGMFGWLVEMCNELCDVDNGSGNWIGLLDIFGFEDFKKNSFEQLCINFANETLQNHYNTYIFTKDMEECRAEGIDVTEVKCPDNMPCLKLIKEKGGVLDMLDEECKLGKGTDISFLDKVDGMHGKHPFYARSKFSKESFVVHHYAASVTYDVTGWLEKNRDTVKDDIRRCVNNSGDERIGGFLEPPAGSDASSSSPKSKKPTGSKTVGAFFANQVNLLMSVINSTNPHWIRCVKPHPAKKALMFHGVQTMNQLESSGVLGTVKIRKAGYPIRMTFDKFNIRYKIIAGDAGAKAASPRELSLAILTACGMNDKAHAQLGNTKIFMKSEAFPLIERKRNEALLTYSKKLQRVGRGYLSRKAFKVFQYRKRCEQLAALLVPEFRDFLKRGESMRARRAEERAAEAKRKEEEAAMLVEQQKAQEAAMADQLKAEEEARLKQEEEAQKRLEKAADILKKMEDEVAECYEREYIAWTRALEKTAAKISREAEKDRLINEALAGGGGNGGGNGSGSKSLFSTRRGPGGLAVFSDDSNVEPGSMEEAQKGLPPFWTCHRDLLTGLPYYVNSITKIKTTHKPSPAPPRHALLSRMQQQHEELHKKNQTITSIPSAISSSSSSQPGVPGNQQTRPSSSLPGQPVVKRAVMSATAANALLKTSPYDTDPSFSSPVGSGVDEGGDPSIITSPSKRIQQLLQSRQQQSSIPSSNLTSTTQPPPRFSEDMSNTTQFPETIYVIGGQRGFNNNTSHRNNTSQLEILKLTGNQWQPVDLMTGNTNTTTKGGAVSFPTAYYPSQVYPFVEEPHHNHYHQQCQQQSQSSDSSSGGSRREKYGNFIAVYGQQSGGAGVGMDGGGGDLASVGRSFSGNYTLNNVIDTSSTSDRLLCEPTCIRLNINGDESSSIVKNREELVENGSGTTLPLPSLPCPPPTGGSIGWACGALIVAGGYVNKNNGTSLSSSTVGHNNASSSVGVDTKSFIVVHSEAMDNKRQQQQQSSSSSDARNEGYDGSVNGSSVVWNPRRGFTSLSSSSSHLPSSSQQRENLLVYDLPPLSVGRASHSMAVFDFAARVHFNIPASASSNNNKDDKDVVNSMAAMNLISNDRDRYRFHYPTPPNNRQPHHHHSGGSGVGVGAGVQNMNVSSIPAASSSSFLSSYSPAGMSTMLSSQQQQPQQSSSSSSASPSRFHRYQSKMLERQQGGHGGEGGGGQRPNASRRTILNTPLCYWFAIVTGGFDGRSKTPSCEMFVYYSRFSDDADVDGGDDDESVDGIGSAGHYATRHLSAAASGSNDRLLLRSSSSAVSASSSSWRSLPNMQMPRSGHGSCVAILNHQNNNANVTHSRVFVCGGRSGYGVTNTVEYLDVTVQNRCTSLHQHEQPHNLSMSYGSSAFSSASSSSASASHNTAGMAPTLGGGNSSGSGNGVSVATAWVRSQPMKYARCDFGCALVTSSSAKQYIFCVGGYDGKDWLTSVECMEVGGGGGSTGSAASVWREVCPLPTPRSSFAICLAPFEKKTNDVLLSPAQAARQKGRASAVAAAAATAAERERVAAASMRKLMGTERGPQGVASNAEAGNTKNMATPATPQSLPTPGQQGAGEGEEDTTAPVTKDGWTRKWDPKSKRHYYVDGSTKKTQWKADGTPWAVAAGNKHKQDDGSGVGGTHTDTSQNEDHGAGGGVGDNGVTVEKKKVEEETDDDPTKPVSIGDWTRRWDATKGKHYYKNKATGVNTYKTEGTPWEGGGQQHEQKAKEGKKTEDGKKVPLTKTQTPPPNPGGAGEGEDTTAPVTKDGWTRKWDPKSKRHYYVDGSTKKTQWKADGTPWATTTGK